MYFGQLLAGQRWTKNVLAFVDQIPDIDNYFRR